MYPPLRIAVSDDVDVVMADDEVDEVDESCGGLAARVAEARRASHGLRDDFFDAGLLILIVLWIGVQQG